VIIVRYCAALLLSGIILSPFAQEPGDDTFNVVVAPGNAMLIDIRCAKVRARTMSEVTAYFSFSDSIPNYFWEADTVHQCINITFVNTQLGGFTSSGMTDTFGIGPVKNIHVVQERRNRNEAIKGLNPDWYDLVTATIACSPMIRDQRQLEANQSGTNIFFSFPWPADPVERNKLYAAVEKKRGRLWPFISLAGVGTAGAVAGGYFLWRYVLKGNGGDGELNPILPDHPSIP
jgi:hypothetical protein